MRKYIKIKEINLLEANKIVKHLYQVRRTGLVLTLQE